MPKYQYVENINKSGKSGVADFTFTDKQNPPKVVVYCDKETAEFIIKQQEKIGKLQQELIWYEEQSYACDCERIDDCDASELVSALNQRVNGRYDGVTMFEAEKIINEVKKLKDFVWFTK